MTRRSFVSHCGKTLAAASIIPVLTRHALGRINGTRTAYAHDPRFVNYYQNSAETPERVAWINSRITASGAGADLAAVTPLDDPRTWIQKIHSPAHIAGIQAAAAYSPAYEPVGPIADLAVGYALGAVRDVCQGAARNAFCCIRPPGHHVQDGGAPLGYCFYANVIIAERFAREQMGITKTLIVDWDFHQGNGTHGFLCKNEAALFFETFSPNMYTTLCDDFLPIGPGDAVPADSRRINVRMPAGASNDDFVRVFEEKLVPAAEQFKPGLVLLSCGFDLKKFDTHGDFRVTAAGISRLTRILMQIADAFAGGKIVSLLEGGYADSPRDSSVAGSAETYSGLSQCAENHVKTLMTGDAQPETPFYTDASTISLSGQPRHGIDIRGGVIRGLSPEEEGPYSLTVTDLNGRTVRSIREITSAGYDLGSLRLPPRRYVVSVRGSRRVVSRVVEL